MQFGSQQSKETPSNIGDGDEGADEVGLWFIENRATVCKGNQRASHYIGERLYGYRAVGKTGSQRENSPRQTNAQPPRKERH
ncbi:MAG TPA: hypothetical protein PLD47_07350 [Aggregatilineales bacterium]|nr:hypothetical protein [Anaerolineales bacterium]HRE47525.1 hypothetical protein [Aggregatilineales bacterium]